MKVINIKKLALVATSIVVIGTGCKTDFDINSSQEDLTAGSLNYRDILPSAISSHSTIIARDFKFLQNWMGYWARSGSYQNDQEEESYSFTNSFPSSPGNPWNDLYYNASNLNYVQKQAKASGSGFYEAICRILKAHDFQMLTDIYGNIPYKEALNGNDIRNPKYDNSVDIYNDLFRQLDTAITLLKDPVASSVANNDKIASNDLVFKGNASLWIKFANTLKLRMLVHCKGGGVELSEPSYDVSGVDVAGEMNNIIAEGSGFLMSGETAKINPGFSASKPNPFYRTFGLTENGVLAGQADLTKANSFAVGIGGGSAGIGYYGYNADPRMNKLYVKPDANTDPAVYTAATYQKGIPYGAVSGFAPGFTGTDLSSINVLNTTSPNSALTPNGAASDAWILTSVESLFLQAEARERGIINDGNDAKTRLTLAVKESFLALGLTNGNANTYLNFNAGYSDVDYDAVVDPASGVFLPGGLYTIISQKWFALNGINPLEVWTDYRRTDVVYGAGVSYDTNSYPWATYMSFLSSAEPNIPVRLFYPQSEYSFNEANAQAQGTIDVFTSRIFWDQQ
jgi:hypothetical protein